VERIAGHRNIGGEERFRVPRRSLPAPNVVLPSTGVRDPYRDETVEGEPVRVLVTGGAGFIGSNLVHAMYPTGIEVGVIDDFSTGDVANLHPAVWLRHMDILDPSLPEVVAGFAPDAIVHLAAQTDVSRSMADPARDREVNLGGTVAVARAAAAAGVGRMLSASSAAVYGAQEDLPIPETAAKHPLNPYGESKLAAEAALAQTLEGTGVDFASMRFANVYGPRQSWKGEGGVVAIFAAALAEGKRPVVYGDGSQTRDFIFVGDIVAFILDALDSPEPLAGPMPDGPAYNIATGRGTSVQQVAAYLSAQSGALKQPESRPARLGDVARSVLDPGKANRRLGWVAQQPIENGLAFTWRWIRSTLG
jgi:UDP-glucose 4-epimerase